jgi:hypothetical protein
MSVVMVVRQPGMTAARIAEIDRADPGPITRPGELLAKHGQISSRRLESAEGVLDIDEWPSEQHVAAFAAEAGEVIAELGRLRGVVPQTTVWRDPS